MFIALNDIENEYRSEIQKALASKEPTAEFLLDISSTLFQKIKIKDISEDDKSNDMLLYKYGIYNWGNFRITYFCYMQSISIYKTY